MSPTPNAARAVADLSDGIILASVDIAVPPEKVFAALTDGSEIIQWWGHDAAYRTTSWVSHLRVGGKWRAEGVSADGKPYLVEGEFLEIDPPRKLVQTWQAQWDAGETTTLTYLLAPTEIGTRLTLRHEGFKGRPEVCQGHSDGWQVVLGWLAQYIAPTPQPAADTAKYYCARLLPPRPDFAQTMSAEERAMMGEHAAYWRVQMAKDKVVVFGPVNDPQGSWGLGVIRVETEAELLDFQANDPAILGKRGLHYENLPMFAAVWRKP
jgi:uncharacterized protein YndB with AHSA1/START domain